MTPTPSPAPASAPSWQGIQFSLGGIPVLIRPAFVIIAVVFGVRGGSPSSVAIWVGVLLVSVLVHELGHAAAMRVYGFSPSIELHAMGGLTAWSREKVPTARQQLIVTGCGPGAGLLLGGLVVIAQLSIGSDAHPLLKEGLRQAIWVNIGWSFINLLPVLPWDGGLILDSAVELIAKQPRPKVAAISSVIVGAAVVLFGLYFQSFLMLIYFGGVGIWQGYSRLAPRKPEDDAFNRIWALMQAHRFAEAERMATDKAILTADIDERAKLYEAVAWSRLLRDDWRGADMAVQKMGGIKPSRHLEATLAAHLGHHEEVLGLLSPLPSSPPEIALRVDALIALKRFEQVVTDACDLLARSDLAPRRLVQVLAARLFEAGAWEPSMQISLTAFDALAEPVHLLNAGCALARLGRLDEGLAMINRAIDAGFVDRKHLSEDDDLQSLRLLPGWATTLARVR